MTTKALPTIRSLVALCLGSLAAIAAPQALGAGLLVADGGFGGQLEIVEQDVHVTIHEGIAVTRIDQVFLNTENRIVEALYTFPVPHAASVSNFSMLIGGKEMVGEVVEKKRAREIYESYKTTRKDPGLLEQVDFKTFELRIFPIAAGAEQRVSITYYQQLDFDHNTATYVYPLATNSRQAIDSRTRGKFSFTIDVQSQIPIVNLYSPSHTDQFVVTSHAPEYKRASLEVREGDLNRDVVITYDTLRPHTGIDVIASKQSDEDGYFMLSMTAGQELEQFATGMDYLFVLDISGSMANDGKLNLSRSAVETFVSALSAEDRFDLMTFNTAPNLHFGTLHSVDEESKNSASEFLLSQQARGGTALRPAIATAYKFKDADRPLNVVIMSDGLTEVNEQAELLASIQDAPAGTRVFCIGVGNDINRPLLKQVAERAGGLAAFISHQDDFSRQAQAFRRKLMRPVATDVAISIEGVEAYELTNGELADLYFGAPIRLLGRYKLAGLAKITVSANVLGRPFSETLDVEFPKRDERHPEIERVWAFERIQNLMNSMRATQADPASIEEIVRLSEGYSIVSEYASFIVLENDAEYARWSIQRRNNVRAKRDQAAQATLREQLSRLRDESLAQIGPRESKPVAATPSLPPSVGSDPVSNSSNLPIAPTAKQTTQRSGDLDLLPAVGGGGAIDPITGLIAAGLAGASVLSAHRRKKRLGERCKV
jgi:Ca-activated chloride channel family protein